MRWITLFALVASLAAVSRAAEDAAPTASADAASAAPEPELEGVVVKRGDGFMTVTMDGPKVVLRFFNEKKEAIAPDVHHAFARFRLSNRRPENRTLVLGPDGMSLVHGRPLRPPYVFKAYITLVQEEFVEDLDEDDDDAEAAGVEKFQVDFP